MNFKNAAIAVLRASDKALHVTEITNKAIEDGLLETEGLTPEASMAAQLATDIKRKGEKSFFVRPEPNTYGLNPANIDRLPSQEEVEEEIAEEEEVEERIKVESSYIGTAGEYRVCSELLFRGFNASIMSVDEGIDIAAVKDNVLIGIQVKTANKNASGDYHYNIRKVSFEKHKAHNVFYIFIMRNILDIKFLVFPYHELEKRVQQGAIREVRKGTLYRVTSKMHDQKVYLGNLKNDVTYYLNNWEILS